MKRWDDKADAGDILFGGVILFIVLSIIGGIIFSIIGLYFGYSEGTRTGDIYKFSKKGLIYKSWEGEMYLEGVRSTGGDNPTLQLDKFYFSIPESEEFQKKEVIDTINRCAEERLKCKITYKQWMIPPIQISTDYVVQDVKVVK